MGSNKDKGLSLKESVNRSSFRNSVRVMGDINSERRFNASWDTEEVG